MNKTNILLTSGLLFLTATLLLQGCQSEATSAPQILSEGAGFGTVKETMDAGGYTYLLVDTGNQSIWLAADRMDAQVGDTVGWEGAGAMTDFHSPSLNRTFSTILFAGRVWVGEQKGISEESDKAAPPGHPTLTDPLVAEPRLAPSHDRESRPVLPDTLTLADIFSRRAELDGKTIKVVGRVVKVNPGILGRNWIHIQEGTEKDGDFDLVVTSLEVAEVGNVVVAEGLVAIDKDFGAGYVFPVLLEKASLRAASNSSPAR